MVACLKQKITISVFAFTNQHLFFNQPCSIKEQVVSLKKIFPIWETIGEEQAVEPVILKNLLTEFTKGKMSQGAPTLQTVTSYIEVLVTDQWSVTIIAISNHRSRPFRLAIWKEGSFASPPNCDSEWIAKPIVHVGKAFLTHKNCLVHRNTVILWSQNLWIYESQHLHPQTGLLHWPSCPLTSHWTVSGISRIVKCKHWHLGSHSKSSILEKDVDCYGISVTFF